MDIRLEEKPSIPRISYTNFENRNKLAKAAGNSYSLDLKATAPAVDSTF
jgi:hypothetical protein